MRNVMWVGGGISGIGKIPMLGSASLILTASTDGSSVTGNTVPTANISVNVDESLRANIQFDGSGIIGKSVAGATITIEIEE